MRQSANESVDYIREAANNGFDVLIYGTTQTARRPVRQSEDSMAMSPPPSLNTGASVWENLSETVEKPSAAGELFETKIDWRAIKVATSETIVSISADTAENELKTDSKALTNQVFAKYGMVDEKASELFRELLAYWNRSAFRQTYEITFEGSEVPDALQTQQQLAKVHPVDAESIRLNSSGKGKLNYSVVVNGSLSELTSSLASVFKGRFKIAGARQGKVDLISEMGEQPAITLKIRNVSLSEASQVQNALASSSDVQTVAKESFTNGEVTMVVKTSQSIDDFGMQLEKLFPDKIRVVSTTPLGAAPRRIEAEHR